ncbi:hypothetical protein R1sor_025005 [Riccia sorocarpa]|uniref:Cilia- and flagella-associated protein 206 n=1 Tax=Riccia sorocarpa TaxID=122646 RepID=A0ABD3G8V6_9MARC
MKIDSQKILMETRLVQAKGDLGGDAVIKAVDPKPLEEMVREVLGLFRDSKGYIHAKDYRYATEIIAAFHIRVAIAQNPEMMNGRTVDEEDYKRVTDLAVQRLLHCDCPAEETIQLQVTVQTALFRSTNDYVKKKNQMNESLDIILGLICDCKPADNRKLYEAVEYLHGLIVNYLMELSRQIDQEYTTADPQLLKADIIAALESVLPKKGLLYWMDLPQEEKITQLEELADVVIGIRVFNKCMKRGGEQFTLPYEKFEIQAEELRKKVQEVIKFVDSRVENCILGIRNHMEEKCIPAELVYPELRNIGVYQRKTLEEYNLIRAHSEAAMPLLALSEKPQFTSVSHGPEAAGDQGQEFPLSPQRGSCGQSFCQHVHSSPLCRGL